MRKFKYKGKSGNVGQYGYVKNGDVLTLPEHEAYSVKDSSEFVPLREPPVEGFPEDPGLPPKGDILSLLLIRASRAQEPLAGQVLLTELH